MTRRSASRAVALLGFAALCQACATTTETRIRDVRSWTDEVREPALVVEGRSQLAANGDLTLSGTAYRQVTCVQMDRDEKQLVTVEHRRLPATVTALLVAGSVVAAIYSVNEFEMGRPLPGGIALGAAGGGLALGYLAGARGFTSEQPGDSKFGSTRGAERVCSRVPSAEASVELQAGVSREGHAETDDHGRFTLDVPLGFEPAQGVRLLVGGEPALAPAVLAVFQERPIHDLSFDASHDDERLRVTLQHTEADSGQVKAMLSFDNLTDHFLHIKSASVSFETVVLSGDLERSLPPHTRSSVTFEVVPEDAAVPPRPDVIHVRASGDDGTRLSTLLAPTLSPWQAHRRVIEFSVAAEYILDGKSESLFAEDRRLVSQLLK